MAAEAKVAFFEDEDQAERIVRWLRRSGMHPRMEQVGELFEVVVTSGPEEQRARLLLAALERTGERIEPAEPTGWGRVRRLLNLEAVGTVFAIVAVAVLLAVAGIWLWWVGAQIGWVAVIVLIVAALVYFQFSGMPHSAVKKPRRYSHKHDITMEQEQQVQYRHAWARDEYRKAQRWAFWRRPKQ